MYDMGFYFLTHGEDWNTTEQLVDTQGLDKRRFTMRGEEHASN